MIGRVEPQTVMIAFLCGGVALSGHSAKAGTRLLVNHSPEPFSNILLSIFEDGLAVIGTWLAVKHPTIMLVIATTFLIVFAWFAPKAFRLMRVEYLASLALLKRLFSVLKQYAYGFARQRQVVAVGAQPNVFFDEETDMGRRSADDWSSILPEQYLHYLDKRDDLANVNLSLRCAAGKGMKGLRHSVGYLQVTNDSLLFVTRRFFRFRDLKIRRCEIDDVILKKRILLDRLILRSGGKQQQLFFFKGTSRDSERVWDILQIHKKHR